MTPSDVAALAAAVAQGQRRALAKALTLVESARADKRAAGIAVTESLMKAGRTGGSLRIAVSGAPGVGKSTFIEALGVEARRRGMRVAVLAVDPSSPVTGGSILGDKTRMNALAADEGAFIRPSPTTGALGGVRTGTREGILLCEAAGHDLVIVETVGVGQSEVEASRMVDEFLTLLQPSAGDELQGLKKGIIEVSDMLVVTKADGALEDLARQTQAEYRSALHYAPPRPQGPVPVLTASSLTGTGIPAVLDRLIAARDAAAADGTRDARRHAQREDWYKAQILHVFQEMLETDARLARLYADGLTAVRAGQRLAPDAARDFWRRSGIAQGGRKDSQ